MSDIHGKHVIQDNLDVQGNFVYTTQAAYILNVNRATIRRWVKEGKLSCQRIGLINLIPKAEVFAIAKQRGIEKLGVI